MTFDIPHLADKYLLVFADQIESGQPTSDTHTVFKELHGELPFDVLRSVLEYVRDHRWAEPTIEKRILLPPNSMGTSGWSRLAELRNPAPAVSPVPQIVIQNHGPSQNSIGDNNSHVQTIGFTTEDLAPVLELLQQLRTESPDDGELADIEEILLSESEPDPAKRVGLVWLRHKARDITTGAMGSVAGTALLELLRTFT